MNLRERQREEGKGGGGENDGVGQASREGGELDIWVPVVFSALLAAFMSACQVSANPRGGIRMNIRSGQ